MRKILWLHGFGGSAKSGIVNFLRKYYPQFDWVAPELNHHPGESIAKINELLKDGDYAAVLGTLVASMPFAAISVGRNWS